MKEKRKHYRLKQVMPVRHCMENDKAVEHTHTTDISAGGLRIATDTRLDVGAKLNIEVNITGMSTPYYAVGEVVWLQEGNDKKKFDIGVRFVRIVPKAEAVGF